MLMSLALGTVFIIAGVMLFLFPPKEINGFYGYRTTSSMKNEWNWTAANRYCSQLLMIFGALLLLVAALTGHFAVTAICTLVSIVLIFVIIENKLKKM